MLVRIVLTLLGMLFVFIGLNDVFQSVIVPRAVGRSLRVSYVLWRTLWWIWPQLSFRLYRGNETGREDFLAVFAPLTLILQLMLWTLLLIIGFGLIFWGSSHEVQPHLHTVFDALYFAGASYFTIGFGDFVGHTGWTRMVSLAAGAAGFGVVGTTTAFLFAIFGAFQSREQFVVAVGARAGNPPSGVALLVIAKEARVEDSLPPLMRSAQSWCALIMETHLAYPVLAYFRSSHDYQSWVGTLGTLLDAATLLSTTVQGEAGEARILYDIARHASRDLAHYFRFPVGGKEPGLTREEFDNACDTLEHAGYRLHDRSVAWERFAELRGAYASNINALAHFFSIPPLQWIGDRSAIDSH